MENVTYQTSGALNRTHFALVSKQEHALSSQEADKATWECFNTIKRRMTKPSDVGIASSFGGLVAGMRSWGLDIPISSGWDSRQVREDLLLLLYCRTSLNENGGKISTSELRFALPSALTLAEAGQTIEERRAGYLFCTEILPPNHEMQLLLVNTIRKDLDSPSIGRIVLALNAIIASPNADVIPAVIQRLEELLPHQSSQVRRRTIHAFRLLSSLEPEILQKCLDYLPSRLKEAERDVKLAALSLLEACFENGYVEEKDFLNVLLDFIKPPKLKRETNSSISFNLLATRSLQTLQKVITSDNCDLSELISMLLRLSTRAVTQHSWSLLLASMRLFAHLPEPTVIDHLSKANREDKHPLFFLRPLLRAKDINITSVLLQSLDFLPVEAWAGENTVATEPLEQNGQPVASDPSPSNIDEADLFGEGVGVEQESPDSNPIKGVALSGTTAALPPLFEESEVGMIMGCLESTDPSIRILTIHVLSRIDSSDTGLIGQYLSSLLDAAKQTVSAGVITDQIQRNNSIIRALEIAEVTAGSTGKAYANLIVNILLQVDGNRSGHTPSSPTPSNRSNATSGTARSTRGRGGVIDEAVEMVLTKARSDPSFFANFSETLLDNFIARQKEESSITLLVICAATACEVEEIQVDLCQKLLDLFSGYLASTSLSIQETLVLSILRLVAIEGINLDRVTTTISDLRERGGRHIQNRCLQFLDQVADLAKWRNIMHSMKPLNIANILLALERTRTMPGSTTSRQNPPSPSRPVSESSLGLSGTNPPKQLRYTAYEKPNTKEATRSRQGDLRANLFREKISQSQVRRRYMDASDLIELTNEVAKDKYSSSRPRVSPGIGSSGSHARASISIQEAPLDDSPFEDGPASPLPDVSIPPFLSRTISPPISPRLSSSGILRSPPVSPRPNLTPRGSPSSRVPQLPSNETKQDVEVTFDIRWDRLGVQAGATSRGWFEGDLKQVGRRLQKLPGTQFSLLKDDSTEMRLELQQGSHSGLMKLRQEEDGSTLWLLRSTSPVMKSAVKGALL